MELNNRVTRQESFLGQIMSSIKKTFNSLTGSVVQEDKTLAEPYYPPFVDYDYSSLNDQRDNYQMRRESYPDDVPKVTRGDYIQTQKRKTNPVIQITQHITNSKYNDIGSNISMRSSNYSAFRIINDMPSPHVSKPKMIINYNDFQIDKHQSKPTLVLNQKHPRDDNNAMSLTLSDASYKKINKSLIEQIQLNQRIKNQTIQTTIKSFDDIRNDIEKKNKANERALEEMKIISMNKKPKFEYEEKKKKINNSNLFKRQKKPIDYEYNYLYDEDENENNNSHLSLGYAEGVMYKGKPKNTDYQMSKSFSLHYENIPKPSDNNILSSFQGNNTRDTTNNKNKISFDTLNNQQINKDKEKEKEMENEVENDKEKEVEKDKEKEKDRENESEIKKDIPIEKRKEGFLFKFEPLKSEQPNFQLFLCGDSSKSKGESALTPSFISFDKKSELFPKNTVNKDNPLKLFDNSNTNINDKQIEKEKISLFPNQDAQENKAGANSTGEDPLMEQKKEKMKFFLKDTFNQSNEPKDNTFSLFSQPEEDSKKIETKEQPKPVITFSELKPIKKPNVAIEPKSKEDTKDTKGSILSQLNSSNQATTTLPKLGESNQSLFNQTNSFIQHAFPQPSTVDNVSKKEPVINPLPTTTSSSSQPTEKGLFDLSNKPVNQPTQNKLFTGFSLGSNINNQQTQNQIPSITQVSHNINDSQMEISPVTSPKMQSQTIPIQNTIPELNKSTNTLFPTSTFPSTSIFNQPSTSIFCSGNLLFNKPPTNSLFETNPQQSNNNPKSNQLNITNAFESIKPANIGTNQNLFSNLGLGGGTLQFSIGKK